MFRQCPPPGSSSESSGLLALLPPSLQLSEHLEPPGPTGSSGRPSAEAPGCVGWEHIPGRRGTVSAWGGTPVMQETARH